MADKISFDDYLKSDNIAVQEVTAQDIFVDTPRKFDFTVLCLCILAVACIGFTCFYFAGRYEPIDDKPDISYVSTVNTNSVQSDKININTADAETLCKLTGVGESKAFNIIVYRSTNGDFESTEQLKEVEGIGDDIYNKIKDKICI